MAKNLAKPKSAPIFITEVDELFEFIDGPEGNITRTKRRPTSGERKKRTTRTTIRKRPAKPKE
jgi:hypothetical protein